MSDYPRDLVNKAGAVREFKSKEEVPPGWFVRDTMEEVNPETGVKDGNSGHVAAAESKAAKKARLAAEAQAAASAPTEEPDAE